MAHTIKKLAVAALLLVSRFAYADSTADLWTALKAANDQGALAAIAAGADVNSVDAGGTAPLSLAACFSGGEVVKALIDAKANIEYVQPANGFTPLTNACTWGNTDAVKLLVAAGANVKIHSKLGLPLLCSALSSSKLDIVKMIVVAGADPKEKYTMAGIELNLLNTMTGVYSPKEKVANILGNKPFIEKAGLTYPARMVNAKESDFTPLEEMTKYVLDNGGGDPNQEMKGTWGCILNQACEFGKTGVVKALIAAGADVNNTKGIFESTPLDFACQKNHADIAEMLLDVKVNIEAITMVHSDGIFIYITPLCVAAMNGSTDCVEVLCKAGANVNYLSVKTEVKGEYNPSTMGTDIYKVTVKNTALTLANGNKHPEASEVLIRYGALPIDDIKSK